MVAFKGNTVSPVGGEALHMVNVDTEDDTLLSPLLNVTNHECNPTVVKPSTLTEFAVAST